MKGDQIQPVQQILRQAEFIVSAFGLQQCPDDQGIEVAFVGRSNAGKSSAMNRLCQRTQLARTSKTPGRTQAINFFLLAEGLRLVDLPGYGYAKVSRQIQRKWQHLLENYLTKRRSLQGIILLMDVRHPMTPIDQQLIEWILQWSRQIHILLTKADKLKQGACKNMLLKTQKHPLLEQNPTKISIQLFSARTGLGCDEVWQLLANWMFPE